MAFLFPLPFVFEYFGFLLKSKIDTLFSWKNDTTEFWQFSYGHWLFLGLLPFQAPVYTRAEL